MEPTTCMVCKYTTTPDQGRGRDERDLCESCMKILVDYFRSIWPQMSPEFKAMNAARMRLDRYKE